VDKKNISVRFLFRKQFVVGVNIIINNNNNNNCDDDHRKTIEVKPEIVV